MVSSLKKRMLLGLLTGVLLVLYHTLAHYIGSSFIFQGNETKNFLIFVNSALFVIVFIYISFIFPKLKGGE